MSIAIAYEVLLAMQVQYTMFYAVAAVCAARGSIIALQNLGLLVRLGQHVDQATRLESTVLTS